MGRVRLASVRIVVFPLSSLNPSLNCLHLAGLYDGLASQSQRLNQKRFNSKPIRFITLSSRDRCALVTSLQNSFSPLMFPSFICLYHLGGRCAHTPCRTTGQKLTIRPRFLKPDVGCMEVLYETLKYADNRRPDSSSLQPGAWSCSAPAIVKR